MLHGLRVRVPPRPPCFALRATHGAAISREKSEHALHSLRHESDARAYFMYYVYIIKSISHKNEIYVGFTTNLQARLKKHNEGGSPHTAKFKPWNLEWYCAFLSKYKALDFEKYLKSHSGKAFANKRLLH